MLAYKNRFTIKDVKELDWYKKEINEQAAKQEMMKREKAIEDAKKENKYFMATKVVKMEIMTLKNPS